MARKNLLTEAELRSFMKLAELRPLGEEKIQEMYGEDPHISEEDELERELDATEDELGAEDRVADEEGDELDAMDMAMDDDDVAPDTVSIDDFMGALEAALEDVLGEPVSTEMDDELAADELEADELEADVDLETDAAIGAEEEELEDEPMMETQEDLVNEVARRVAARLQEKNSQENMIDALAERIMRRLTK